MYSEVKSTYLKANTKLILRFLLLCLLAFVIYKVQIKFIDLKDIRIVHFFPFVSCVLLIPLNLYLEFFKLKIGISKRGDIVNNFLVKSFLQGLLVSFFTPELLGNSFGRMQINEDSKNAELIAVSFIQGLAQFVLSILMAVIGLLVIGLPKFQFLIGLFIVIATLALILYFFGHKINLKSRFNTLNKFFIGLKFNNDRWPIFGISFLRYLVFSLQFHLLMLAFGINWNVEQIFILMISFGIITLSPSILFGKIIVREGIAVAIFSFYGYEPSLILYTAFSTWFLNVVTPVIFAGIYLVIKNK